MRLGKRSLDDLARRWAKGRENGAPASRDVVWDDELKGFGVRRQGAGAVSFVMSYRVKGDVRRRWITLGSWPAVHPDAAREAAREIKAAAALGRDLLAEREAAAAAVAAEAAAEARRVAAEMEERRTAGIPLVEIAGAFHVKLEAAMTAKLLAGRSGLHERELLRLLLVRLRPALVGAEVGSFDPDSLQALLDGASGHSAAVNLRTLISRFARFARSWLAERGVKVNWHRSYDIQQERPVSRDHRYSLEEAARLWIGAGALGRRGALVRFMLLTACRRSEAQRLAWDYVVLAAEGLGPRVELPAARVKHLRATAIPLCPAAAALLRWLPPRESRRAGEAELVFAGRGNRPVGGWTDIRRALLVGAGVADGTLHDIRRTVVSTLADHGWEPSVVDRLLNHAASSTVGGVMAVYQRSEQWAQRRAAIEAWAALLFGEVDRLLGQPVSRESWGLDAPFEEARIKRARRRRAARRAAEAPARRSGPAVG
jgi:integrase